MTCKKCGGTIHPEGCRLCEMFAAAKAAAAPHPEGWPMRSKALGVSRRQVAKANEYSRKHGLPVEYDPADGKAIINSANDRRVVMKHYGLFDQDAFL